MSNIYCETCKFYERVCFGGDCSKIIGYETDPVSPTRVRILGHIYIENKNNDCKHYEVRKSFIDKLLRR